jgi:quercetin dioxygenase-like cupin family protein
MKSLHLVRTADQALFETPAAYARISAGYRRWSVVNRESGSVHQEFGICELDAGGWIDTHVHSFEESIYVLEGEIVVDTGDGTFLLRPGDYGVFLVAAPHAIRNVSGTSARWAEMLAPQPRLETPGDVFPVAPLPNTGPPVPLDARDPRTRFFGNITPGHMDPRKQSQELLAVSASMRTALLVYSGITVKMMVDSQLGAYLATMFMVKYEPNGLASSHDHPFEETYLITEGTVDAWFDGATYVLKPGDIAWAGVGCIHGFRNTSGTTVSWLETSAPQPPARYSYRFARDWSHLEQVLEKTREAHAR